MKYIDMKEVILRLLAEKPDVLSVRISEDGTFHLTTTTGPVTFKLVAPESLGKAELLN